MLLAIRVGAESTPAGIIRTVAARRLSWLGRRPRMRINCRPRKLARVMIDRSRWPEQFSRGYDVRRFVRIGFMNF